MTSHLTTRTAFVIAPALGVPRGYYEPLHAAAQLAEVKAGKRHTAWVRRPGCVVPDIGRWSPRLMFTVIKSQLSRSVPFARLLGIAVSDVSASDASVLMDVGPTLTNHVGTAHAGALFTACESASGAALAGALLPVIMQLRFVVRDTRIDYLKPARGRLTARAALVEDAAVVLEQLQRSGRADVAVDVSAQTVDGTVVAKASFNWHLKMARAD